MVKVSGLTLFVGMAIAISILPVEAQQQPVMYECEGGRLLEVSYAAGEARLTLPLEVLTLPEVVAASGARYSDGRTTLYTQGNEAFIEVDGQRTYANCITQDASLTPAAEPIPAPAQSVTPPDQEFPQIIDYQCNYNRTFQAAYRPTTVELRFGAAPILLLPQVPSGSSIRYSDGQVTLSSQGDQAMIEVGESIVYENCVAQAATSTPAVPANVPTQPIPAPVPGLW